MLNKILPFQMLQKNFEITDQLYNPINNMTQNELMEKFNLAFYEGQNLSKADILSTFKDVNEDISLEESSDSNQTNVEINETNDDYLIDYLLSNSPVSTPSSDVDITFDFNDFVNDFDENFSKSENQTDNDENFDNETFTTEGLEENDSKPVLFPLFTPPSITCNKNVKACLDNLEIEEIQIDEDLIDFEDLRSDLQDIDDSICESSQEKKEYNSYLTPAESISKNNMEFNNFLRNTAADDISYYNQVKITSTILITYSRSTITVIQASFLFFMLYF